MADLDRFLDEAHSVHERVVDLRRRIHEEPEIGLETPATRAKVLDELSDLDLDLTLHESTSGVVATLRGAERGRRVLLRGDMDALPIEEDTGLPFASTRPGQMHACGHDAHTAMLTGAARLLCARRDALAGEIVFMFQPGEELVHGARYMVEEGLPEVDAAFALHVAPQIPSGMIGSRPGAMLASFDDFEIQLRGEGGHASMPHDCIDPVPVACEVVMALQSFVTRRISVADPAIITATQIEAGNTSNVIPETVRIRGTIRALSEATRERCQSGLGQVAEGIAKAHGLEASVDFQFGYPVTVNDAGFEGFARGVAAELLGEARVLTLPTATMGAEDFSYVLQRAPGAMMMLGVRPPGEGAPAPCHSARMRLDEEAMVHGIALHAAVATRFLETGAS